MTDTLRLGLIGVGNMGAPMARRLSAAGHALVIYDLQRAALDALVASDPAIRAAEDLSEVGESCQVVITMLPDSAAVRQAVMGDEGQSGLVQAMARTMGQGGGVIVDMSSSAPTATVALGAELQDHGLDLVDAPVSGGVPRARDGSLTIMAGGTPTVVDRVAPILAAMGTVHRTGPLGSGHAMKALNNYVSAAGLLAVAEALIIAQRFGLDPKIMNDVLKVSTGRNNATDNKVEQYLLNRAFNSGFALDLLLKDVTTAEDLATDLALDAPWLKTCRALLDQATQALDPGADHTAAFAFLEQRLIGRDQD
jgi:3-hydroxyisobutyrate dehydrogenase